MLAIIEQQVAGLLAFAFYFFYVHPLSSLRTILFHLHATSQYFRNRLQDAPVRVPYRRRLFAPYEFRNALYLSVEFFRRESYEPRSSWTGDWSRMRCSGLGSAYRSHAANSRETKRNRTFNIAFTCGTAAGSARRSPMHTHAYAAFHAHMHLPARKHTSTGGRYHVRRTRYLAAMHAGHVW